MQKYISLAIDLAYQPDYYSAIDAKHREEKRGSGPQADNRAPA
jgi:hypothetical protein